MSENLVFERMSSGSAASQIVAPPMKPKRTESKSLVNSPRPSSGKNESKLVDKSSLYKLVMLKRTQEKLITDRSSS